MERRRRDEQLRERRHAGRPRFAPRIPALTGTSRQPSTRRRSSAAIASIRVRALAASSGSAGRKAVPTAIAAGCRQLESAHRPQEAIGDLHQDAGSVAGVRLGARGATVVEVAQGGQGLDDDVVARLAGQRGDEGDAAGIVFVLTVVEAWVLGPGVKELRAPVPLPSSSRCDSPEKWCLDI
jgi:hypothetical protein